MLAGISGAVALIAAKRARVQELCAKWLADKPAHVQHRELDERIEKHTRAMATLVDKTIPALEEQLGAAHADLAQRKEAVVQLRAQKDALLQSSLEVAADDGERAKFVRDTVGKLASLFEGAGPAAAPCQEALRVLDAEMAKYQATVAATSPGPAPGAAWVGPRSAAVAAGTAGSQPQAPAADGGASEAGTDSGMADAEVDTWLDQVVAASGGTEEERSGPDWHVVQRKRLREALAARVGKSVRKSGGKLKTASVPSCG